MIRGESFDEETQKELLEAFLKYTCSRDVLRYIDFEDEQGDAKISSFDDLISRDIMYIHAT